MKTVLKSIKKLEQGMGVTKRVLKSHEIFGARYGGGGKGAEEL